jgi:hypothetical protein
MSAGFPEVWFVWVTLHGEQPFVSCFALSIPQELGHRDRPSRANKFKLRHYQAGVLA